ncbi:phage holin family protein [Microbacterium sp. HD4P20]|uniref:phage holin family protein n=1 Tax=Microbacterium sp. HD4P20 TaxID=2864874 RepID=UPI001C63E8AB|nr:phage holin family protein [Microbacterium sp. HD4P20]MCP2638031.1 phage holin family protein [Microbacterium sp. HD4P20]
MSDMPTPSQQKAATTSVGELVGEVSRDLSELMRKELELAKAELEDSAKKAGAGAGLLGGAGYAASMTLLFLSIALWWALATLVGGGGSGIIVALVWGVVAGVLYSVGMSRLKAVRGAPRTVETVKEIPEALKRNEENRS